MGLGYTTMMYDGESIQTGLSDIRACQYDGAEMGFEKVKYVGAMTVQEWLAEYDLEFYCVMAEWPVDEAAVKRIREGADVAAEAGASYYGLLPPERHREDEETLARWLDEIGAAAGDAGVTPLIHHHGATAIEQPDEIAHWLKNGPEEFELLFDTAHYYPYGDVLKGIERFADDIAYVHLKDVDPTSEFDDHARALSEGTGHLDDVINYFRAFTDLGEGVLDFQEIHRMLTDVDYDGHYTIEIENRSEPPLIHAKRNFDFWADIVGRQ